jgi:TPR repeat protein
VRDNPHLVWTFVGVGSVLLVWTAVLWAVAGKRAGAFAIEWAPIKSHYIQACVHFSIYAYWGFYWRKVYDEAPLILSQIFFLYAVDALLSWSRGRPWRLGFGAIPITFSTNFFLWFKDDWFYYQFLMVAIGAFGKEFVRWKKDGKSAHIFNPSAVGLSVASIVLIATNTTHITWGIEVASTLAAPPHIYLEIFLLGLVVQYFFSVTLMTLSAMAVLCLMNGVYTQITGTYHFIDTNVPIAVFLGLHLLVTDPATSPRTNAGRVIFGGLYGFGNFFLYWVFEHYGLPEFYDKLLPVPILNLSVRAIDRWSAKGILGQFNRWEAGFAPRKVNLAHMGCWAVLFLWMLFTGRVDAPHPGSWLAFWESAYERGAYRADKKLMKLAGAQAQQGDGHALNLLGTIHMEGTLAAKDDAAAAHYFSTACEAGNIDGCANVATQFLFLRAARSDDDVARALHGVERGCAQGKDGGLCWLVGYASESGRGRPMDDTRALELYREGRRHGSLDACKAEVRLTLATKAESSDLKDAAQVLERASIAGDAESSVYLAYVYLSGFGIPRDEAKARLMLQRACAGGSESACNALQQHAMPALSAAPAPRWRGGLKPVRR